MPQKRCPKCGHYMFEQRSKKEGYIVHGCHTCHYHGPKEYWSKTLGRYVTEPE